MDIGNNVFSCGQVYVALSRVTSSNGLHLINYDPSSVKASEGAITEYNHLKRTHDPNVEMITVSEERHRKVKDVPWALPRVVTSIQKSSSDRKVRQSAWVVRGFQNTDKVPR